ncbi:MAG: RNA 2'-phosphotransferase, partial [bacterium]|nr:RNA 2'-phosphotransferase [bacterium]
MGKGTPAVTPRETLESISEHEGDVFGVPWGKVKMRGKGKGKEKGKKGAEERPFSPISGAKGRTGPGKRRPSPGPFAGSADSRVGKGLSVSGAEGPADKGKGQQFASAAKGGAGKGKGGKFSEAKGRKGRKGLSQDPRSAEAEGGQCSELPGGEPDWELSHGTEAEPLLTRGSREMGRGPLHDRRGREVADIISAESRACGALLSFPEKLVDPAWSAPESFVQEPPFVEVCQRRLLHAMRVTDLTVPAELCTKTRVDVSGPWANRASHRAVALLRHNALNANLPIDDGGWALLYNVARRVGVEPGVLIMIAAADDKGRFQLAHYAPNGVPSSTVL